MLNIAANLHQNIPSGLWRTLKVEAEVSRVSINILCIRARSISLGQVLSRDSSDMVILFFLCASLVNRIAFSWALLATNLLTGAGLFINGFLATITKTASVNTDKTWLKVQLTLIKK